MPPIASTTRGPPFISVTVAPPRSSDIAFGSEDDSRRALAPPPSRANGVRDSGDDVALTSVEPFDPAPPGQTSEAASTALVVVARRSPVLVPTGAA